MISKEMKELVEKSAALSAMFTEGAKLKERYGAENVYDFGMGNPSVKAPAIVNETAIRLLQEMDSLLLHSYTNSSGIPAAREKIAASINHRFGTAYTEKNLILTAGAAGGLNVIFKVLLEKGEEVVTFAPYFGEYDRYVENAGGKLIAVPPNVPSFLPDPEQLKALITEKTKAVILNNPNNPTGVVYDEETIKAIAAVLQEKGKTLGTDIYLISDEPYRELVYDGVVVPYIPKYYENTIVVYSFSKSLSLPGDRIGYLLIPDTVADFENVIGGADVAMRALGFINAPALQQMVAAECCDAQSEISYYAENRALLYDALQKYGYTCAKPQGAFYIFVKVPNGDDKAFVEKAKEHRILLTAGSGFGCSGYVRIAYCVAKEMIQKALPAFKALAEEYK